MALDTEDKTTNNNDLTNSGGAETADTPFAQSTGAVDLESLETDFLYAADSASLSIISDITIEAWINMESTPIPGNVMAVAAKLNQATNQRSYALFLYNDDTAGNILRWLLQISDDGTARDQWKFTHALSTGTWYHIAVAWDASEKTAELYIDTVSQGSKVADVADADATAIFDSTAQLLIGATGSNTSPGDLFDGKLDEVRIWNDIRTSTEISNNYNIEIASDSANLQAYYPFDSLANTTTSTSTSTTSTSSSTSTTTTTSTSTSTSTSTTSTS